MSIIDTSAAVGGKSAAVGVEDVSLNFTPGAGKAKSSEDSAMPWRWREFADTQAAAEVLDDGKGGCAWPVNDASAAAEVLAGMPGNTSPSAQIGGLI